MTDRLESIKAWVGDRLDRDSIVMGRDEVEWLVSEVEKLRTALDDRREVAREVMEDRTRDAAGLE